MIGEDWVPQLGAPSSSAVRDRGSRLRVSTTQGWWLAIVMALGACGSRSVEEVALAPTLAENPRVQRELRELEEAWDASSISERANLAPRLKSSVRRYPNDPGTHRARILLAWIELEQGELDVAERTLEPALEASRGSTLDHARLVHAALLTRRGKPTEALDILEPLRGKLVGQEIVRLYGRERSRAALEARRWRLLIAALTQWLEESPQGQEWVRRRVLSSLAEVPSHALMRVVEDRLNEVNRDPSAVERWMERAMLEHLSRTALATSDSRLARQLLQVAPGWLRASPAGDQLTYLIREGPREARVAGRTLGLVVEEEGWVARSRSAQLVAGVVEALGMGRAEGSSAVRLVVRENRGSMGATLAALAGEGASVLIAGVEEVGASVALAFAEERRVPVIVLVDPAQRPQELSYGFVLGVAPAAARSLLEEAFAKAGVERPQLIGEEGFACDARPSYPGAPRFPFGAWQREGGSGVLVLGDAACARQAAQEARSVAKGMRFGLGLEASHALFGGMPEGTWGVGAGSYPGGAGRVSPPWFELLGRDAARLGQAALAVVPEDVNVDGEAVRAHLERARDALLGARQALETTAAPGFARNHVIQRELRLLQVDGTLGGEK